MNQHRSFTNHNAVVDKNSRTIVNVLLLKYNQEDATKYSDQREENSSLLKSRSVSVKRNII